MKTAIDFYERGKLKEADADEYNRSSYYSRNRFICPECGEPVHLTGSKYANFFSHYKKTDISAECERRADAIPSSSLYQRIGLPLYLRCEDQEHKAELENFAVSEKIHKEISNIENSSCWTLCLSIDSESKEAAKLLDSLNSKICDQFNPTVLSNGCSAYFNKSLYPIVNEFERKLRKLLYLASALQGDNDVNKVIIDLEIN